MTPTEKKPNNALAALVTPSPALAQVVGAEPLPRTEVTKRVWDYIKQHDLQDPNDKRTIRADDKLRPLFDGADSVNMMKMTGLISKHMAKA
jgi:chromatin remodeling complex protein RSC6